MSYSVNYPERPNKIRAKKKISLDLTIRKSLGTSTIAMDRYINHWEAVWVLRIESKAFTMSYIPNSLYFFILTLDLTKCVYL